MNATNATVTNPDNAFLAVLLARSGRAIAAEAAARLLESRPAAGEGFGHDPLAAWQGWLVARIDELASAAAVARPEVFTRQVLWAHSALGPRGIDAAAFRDSLVVLRQVMSEELPERVHDLVATYIDRALHAFDLPAEASDALPADEPFRRLVAEYLLAVFEGDARRAVHLVLDAAKEHSLADLYLRVLMPAQREVGRMWLAGEITVADEHMATLTARRLMALLVERGPARPANGKTMLVAAVAGNRHDLGTQAVADFFELDGWRTVRNSAPTSLPTPWSRCLIRSPSISYASRPRWRSSCPSFATRSRPSARGRGGQAKILVGGRALEDSPELARELGADAFALDARDAVVTGRRLVGLDA